MHLNYFHSNIMNNNHPSTIRFYSFFFLYSINRLMHNKKGRLIIVGQPLAKVFSLFVLLHAGLFIFLQAFPTIFQGCVGGCQACDGYTERRAAHVVVPHDMAKLDRIGVATMLPTDANFELWAGLAPVIDRHAHYPSPPTPISRLLRG